jgi:hypothetical protein
VTDYVVDQLDRQLLSYRKYATAVEPMIEEANARVAASARKTEQKSRRNRPVQPSHLPD